MEGDLQKQFMELSDNPYEMMNQIKEMFKEKARTERYNTLKELHACKMSAGGSVSPHVLKMKGILDHLTRLGLGLGKEMAANIVLQSLPPAYDGFIMNYNMHDIDKTVSELHDMLQTAENTYPKSSSIILKIVGSSRNGLRMEHHN